MSTPFVCSVEADAAMRAEAERTYPHECCGIVLSRGGAPESLRVRPFENQQQRLHAADPEGHPRDARTAYTFDALALERVLRDAAEAGLELAAIFHSHPDHGAYFSDTDRAAATPFGTATFPQAAQLVYAVPDGTATDVAAFRWDGRTNDFVAVPIELAPGTGGA